MIVGRLYNRQKKSANDGGKGTPKASGTQNEGRLPEKTAAKIAKEHGVSRATVERATLALRLESEIAARAKAKEFERKTTSQKSDKSDIPPIDTKREVATIAGVSRDTVAKVKKIEEDEALFFY